MDIHPSVLPLLVLSSLSFLSLLLLYSYHECRYCYHHYSCYSCYSEHFLTGRTSLDFRSLPANAASLHFGSCCHEFCAGDEATVFSRGSEGPTCEARRTRLSRFGDVLLLRRTGAKAWHTRRDLLKDGERGERLGPFRISEAEIMSNILMVTGLKCAVSF